MYTMYIDSDKISWYAYKSTGEKAKLNKSEHEACGIKKFCVRASDQLVDSTTARVTYGIVTVSFEELIRRCKKLRFYMQH